KLGFGEITFVARWNGQETKRRATLSVRPAGPYMTEVHSGSFKDKIDVELTRDMHPEFRKLDATVSALPRGLARGLDAYLKGFPYGCSEQITIGAFCRSAHGCLRDLHPHPRRCHHHKLHPESARLFGEASSRRMAKRCRRRLSRRRAPSSAQRQRRRALDRQLQDRQSQGDEPR